MSSEGMTVGKVIDYILYAIALAMGIASTVLSTLGEPITTSVQLLGIGMFAVALAGMNSIRD